jgi:hypothetical protein
LKSGTVKDHGHTLPACFISIIISFDKAFKYGDDATFVGYIGTDPEMLCAEFRNVVQCHDMA